MQTLEPICLEVSLLETCRGMRLDLALAKCFPEHSRSRLTQWIKCNQIKVDGEIWTPKRKVQGKEQIKIEAQSFALFENCAEDIPLSIVYEDPEILVINKPAGLVVHPGAGNLQGTLLNALLYHAPDLSHLPRAGIIHRLDKDTTGLMVIAKTLASHTFLVGALARREVAREYLALVGSEIIAGKTIDAPIGRHPQHRIKMAVVGSGKPAITHYRCRKRYHGFTLLHVKLETGRTHQIRVHLSQEGHPIVGDAVYGWRHRVPPHASEALKTAVMNFQRQALHAWRLSLIHPVTREKLTWDVPLPPDFLALLKHLLPLEPKSET